MSELQPRNYLPVERNSKSELSYYTVKSRDRGYFLSPSFEVVTIDTSSSIPATGEYKPAGVLTKDPQKAAREAKERWVAASSLPKVLFFGITDKELIEIRKEQAAAHGNLLTIDGQLNLALPNEKRSIRMRYKNALRFLTEYSNRISSANFAAGNVLLTAKAGIHPDMDTLAGFLFGISNVPLYLADKYPTSAYRAVGTLVLAGAGALSSNGINFAEKQIDWWRVASPAGFATTSILLGLQKEIAQGAEKAKNSKNRLKRAFAASQRYPVTLGGVIDSMSTIGMGISAYKNKDWKTLGAMVLYGVGAVELALSDPRMRMNLRNYIGIYPIDKKSEQEGEEQSESQGGTIFDSRQLNFPLSDKKV